MRVLLPPLSTKASLTLTSLLICQKLCPRFLWRGNSLCQLLLAMEHTLLVNLDQGLMSGSAPVVLIRMKLKMSWYQIGEFLAALALTTVSSMLYFLR